MSTLGSMNKDVSPSHIVCSPKNTVKQPKCLSTGEETNCRTFSLGFSESSLNQKSAWYFLSENVVLRKQEWRKGAVRQGKRVSQHEGIKEWPYLLEHLSTVLGVGRREENYLLAPGPTFAPRGVNGPYLEITHVWVFQMPLSVARIRHKEKPQMESSWSEPTQNRSPCNGQDGRGGQGRLPQMGGWEELRKPMTSVV